MGDTSVRYRTKEGDTLSTDQQWTRLALCQLALVLPQVLPGQRRPNLPRPPPPYPIWIGDDQAQKLSDETVQVSVWHR